MRQPRNTTSAPNHPLPGNGRGNWVADTVSSLNFFPNCPAPTNLNLETHFPKYRNPYLESVPVTTANAIKVNTQPVGGCLLETANESS